jgi:transposase
MMDSKERKWSNNELLPDHSNLVLLRVEAIERGWLVHAESNHPAHCPLCGARSTRRHSRYWRTLRDLPVQGNPITLRLRVGRWRCRNRACERRIFTERAPETAAPHHQRTRRMDLVVQLIGHSLGGRPAEKLMCRLGMAVSDDTILRHLKTTAPPAHSAEQLRVVGIDDWAWKKGQNYGTILVDLERRKVADLLPERSAEQLAEWLQQHASVEIVSRDRFGLYARGAQKGAPQAHQLADRFHLLMNLKEAVEHELSRHRRQLVCGSPTPLPLPNTEPQSSSPMAGGACNAERAKHERLVVSERRANAQALFDLVHSLRRSGNTVSAIVKSTGISRKRVDKWIRLSELPERNKMEPRRHSPAFFREFLARRWASGCHRLKTLMAELRPLGYTGCFSGLAKFVSPWRRREQAPPLSENARTSPQDNPTVEPGGRFTSSLIAASLLFKPRPHLTPAQAHKVDTFKQVCPNFALMRSMVMEFRNIVRHGRTEALEGWLRKARDSDIYSFGRFAKTLGRDLDAVQNALREPFSNGPVEGHINRLKTLKRQMYGRAGYALLRARLLQTGPMDSKMVHQT